MPGQKKATIESTLRRPVRFSVGSYYAGSSVPDVFHNSKRRSLSDDYVPKSIIALLLQGCKNNVRVFLQGEIHLM